MPALIASVELKPDVTVAAGDDSDVEDEDEDVSWVLKGRRGLDAIGQVPSLLPGAC